MKPRTRKVRSVRDQVISVLGPGKGVEAVFPLSPSSMVWNYQSGCSLVRYLKKAHGWSTALPWRVLRGSVLDRFLMNILESPTLDPQKAKEALYGAFFELKDGFDLDKPDMAYLEEAHGLSLILMEHFAGVQASETQKQVTLDLREEPDGIPPKPHEYVNGFLDFVVRSDGGVGVRDLKVTSSKPCTKSLGKHKLQLGTYSSALWQEGVATVDQGLEQLHVPSKQVIPCTEPFTERDYDRTIQIFREAVLHYLRVADGTGDFRIPFRGDGKCKHSRFSCDFYLGCPMGGNQAEARREYRKGELSV